jgi:hypothetical protein
VERAYLVLLDTMLLVYFIPYLYLFVCYMVESVKAPAPRENPWLERKPATWVIGLSGLLLTVGAMVVATIPPSDTAEPWMFRLKVIGGAGLFVLLGGVVYWRGRRSAR